MAEHRFDPVAFVFGGLALAAGTIVLAGGELTDEGRVLLPGGLIALGVAVLASVARREGREAAAIEPSAVIGGESGDDHSDLDDLFAPVDDVLTSWPTDPARGHRHRAGPSRRRRRRHRPDTGSVHHRGRALARRPIRWPGPPWPRGRCRRR